MEHFPKRLANSIILVRELVKCDVTLILCRHVMARD